MSGLSLMTGGGGSGIGWLWGLSVLFPNKEALTAPRE